MGQKTNPIGLRVGLSLRKWNNTWYTENKNLYKNLFFSHYYIDKFLQNFLHYYSYTKKSFIKRALLVNTRFIKSNFALGFLFIFFYKIRSLKKKKKRKKIKFYLKKKQKPQKKRKQNLNFQNAN